MQCNIAHLKTFFPMANLVKFPHSPILHYAFSSWIEKTMTKTIHHHWETDLFYNSMGLCGNFIQITISHVKKRERERTMAIHDHSNEKFLYRSFRRLE